jgi:hypothetical protein
MNGHPIQWQSPQPLWARFGATATQAAGAEDQARPAILRFATDDFMDQIIGTLARDPAQIGRLLARPETWRKPLADAPDLIERMPVPRLAQSAVRRGAAKTPKAVVTPVAAQAELQEQAVKRNVPLKLYQPAHQRFYLVGASLVCGEPGLPERAVVPGGAEQVNFVVRRVLQRTERGTDPADVREFAYIKDGGGARWQLLENGDAGLAPGEELLPVFPLAFNDDAQRARTLWAGMVPVGRREEYLSGNIERTPAMSFASGQRQSVLPAGSVAREPARDARLAQFKLEVAEPWKGIVRSSYKAAESLNRDKPSGLGGDGEFNSDKRKRVFDFNLQQQMASWLILLDFADYLAAYLPDVWDVIKNGGAGAASLPTQARRDLYARIAGATMSPALIFAMRQPLGAPYVAGAEPVLELPSTASDAPFSRQLKAPATSLGSALRRIVGARAGLERAEGIYSEKQTAQDSTDWPDFHYLLGGLERSGASISPFQPFATSTTTDAQSSDEVGIAPGTSLSQAQKDAEDAAARIDVLTAKIFQALEPNDESDAPPPPFALQVAKALRRTAGDPGWFVARFVYTRRDCGPLHPPTLSAPTQRFQLANFFDADAPARPIRISLPLDTSPAGLRKHNKNTAFVLSDMLCGQVQRAKGLGFIDLVLAVLPWPLHKDLDVGEGGPCRTDINIGMICSLSIPIITICALILLMIIVALLDMIFRWLPFFIICFPVRGLRGKGG